MSKNLYIFLSLLCAVSVFLMSSVFQSMAHWGEGTIWYWVGVTITCLIWLLGIIFLVVAKKSRAKSKSIMGIVSFIILICGFFWTVFIIMAGLSGM